MVNGERNTAAGNTNTAESSKLQANTNTAVSCKLQAASEYKYS
jgi:hypothetical protein